MKGKRGLHILILIGICLLPLGVVTGCGVTDRIRCTACGDNENRLILYASGTDSHGYEYKSCVGPAGILGCGLDTRCWPTECVKTTMVDAPYKETGCVYYYNNFGCIDKSETMTYGKYMYSASCIGARCYGRRYIESDTGESVSAYEKESVLGISCGKTVVDPENRNQEVERHFENGCWSCEDSEDTSNKKQLPETTDAEADTQEEE